MSIVSNHSSVCSLTYSNWLWVGISVGCLSFAIGIINSQTADYFQIGISGEKGCLIGGGSLALLCLALKSVQACSNSSEEVSPSEFSTPKRKVRFEQVSPPMSPRAFPPSDDFTATSPDSGSFTTPLPKGRGRGSSFGGMDASLHALEALGNAPYDAAEELDGTPYPRHMPVPAMKAPPASQTTGWLSSPPPDANGDDFIKQGRASDIDIKSLDLGDSEGDFEGDEVEIDI